MIVDDEVGGHELTRGEKSRYVSVNANCNEKRTGAEREGEGGYGRGSRRQQEDGVSERI